MTVYGDGPMELTMRNNDLGIETAVMIAYTFTLSVPLVHLSDGTCPGADETVEKIGPGSSRLRLLAWQMAARSNAQ